MQIVNLLDNNGSKVTARTHVNSVFTSDGISLGSKLMPTQTGVTITGNATATSFIGNLQGTADTASKTTGSLTLTVDGTPYTFNGSSNQSISISTASGSKPTVNTSNQSTMYVAGLTSTTTSSLSTLYRASGVYVSSGTSVYASEFYANSSREIKENIIPSQVDALEVINRTQIYDFNYIVDETKKPKVGIIAEEAPDLLVSNERDAMDSANAIGLLLSAVQRLSQKLDILEAKMGSV